MSTKRRIVVADDGPVSIVRFVDKKIVDSASIEQLGEELNSIGPRRQPERAVTELRRCGVHVKRRSQQADFVEFQGESQPRETKAL